MRPTLVFICVCCLSIAPVAARMYQWHNPATGTTQLSGTPPAWYRSSDPGPRVFVFENNQLVDDTGITVSDAQREALRAEAFGAASAAATAMPMSPRAGQRPGRRRSARRHAIGTDRALTIQRPPTLVATTAKARQHRSKP